MWRDWKTTGNPAARDRLVLSYAPMVRYLTARKMRELPARCELEDLVSAQARDSLHLRIGKGDLPLAVEHDDAYRAGLHDPGHQVALTPQRFKGLLALGNVAHKRDIAFDIPLLVQLGVNDQFDGDPGAILVHVFLFKAYRSVGAIEFLQLGGFVFPPLGRGQVCVPV